MPGNLHKLRARTRAERILLVEVAILLAATRAAVPLLPFRRATRVLRLVEGTAAIEPDPGQLRQAQAIGWAVGVAAAHVPWGGTCLTQALAASVLLRRRGIPSTVYLGVAKDAAAEGGFAAHAWVRCGDSVLVGEGSLPRFTAVASYT